MKYKNFLSIGLLSITNIVNAGFISSYALGVPTSMSARSIAGAVMSKDNEDYNQEESRVLRIKSLSIDKKFEEINTAKLTELFGEDHIFDKINTKYYSFELSPKEEIKLIYNWDIYGNDKKYALESMSVEKRNKFIKSFLIKANGDLELEKKEDFVLLKNKTYSNMSVLFVESKGMFINQYFLHSYEYLNNITKEFATIRKKEKQNIEIQKDIAIALAGFGVLGMMGFALNKRKKKKI